MTFKVLVCGGRQYDGRDVVFRALDQLAADHGDRLFIIEGGARGADQWAREWRKDRRVPGQTFPADWRGFGKAAGMVRNRQMLIEGKPDMVLAFPGGRGTRSMVQLAEAAGVEVQRRGGAPGE